MRLIIIFFLLFVFVSCQKNKKETSIIVEKIRDSVKNIEQKLNAYCFYKLDNKYSVEMDSLIINRWLKGKSEMLIKNDSMNNIFNQKAGGPNGAEWNPSTDLYIAILTPSNESTEDIRIHINGKLFKDQVYKYNSYLIWYLVRQDFWEREIKEIDTLDVEKMYSTEFLNGIKNREFNPVADLNFGEILKFEISCREEKLMKFFHATYGE